MGRERRRKKKKKKKMHDAIVHLQRMWRAKRTERLQVCKSVVDSWEKRERAKKTAAYKLLEKMVSVNHPGLRESVEEFKSRFVSEREKQRVVEDLYFDRRRMLLGDRIQWKGANQYVVDELLAKMCEARLGHDRRSLVIHGRELQTVLSTAPAFSWSARLSLRELVQSSHKHGGSGTVVFSPRPVFMLKSPPRHHPHPPSMPPLGLASSLRRAVVVPH
eukprot:TRINITY_DN9139_c1_g1_i1.p1 TRINITY_DN9139_c1_g1~~TRINITY_DN9139_c1_g1_i1.p1  ORF type:complete len:218 (+),score=30.04 TRINITY_DN9139_c1_g1_i1:191-844(+)